jgi:GGDEF domain-containing protein
MSAPCCASGALARAGAALVAATDRADVATATLQAVRELLATTAVTRSILSVGQPGGAEFVVLASQGHQADLVRGVTVHLSRVPARYRLADSTRQLMLDATALGELEQALGFAPHPGTVTLTPLRARSAPIGGLVVESPGRLPAECADGLTALAAEAALAFENLRLTEDLRRDIAERQALEGELAHRAFHDPPTELPNRALLVERLQHALARSRRGPR